MLKIYELKGLHESQISFHHHSCSTSCMRCVMFLKLQKYELCLFHVSKFKLKKRSPYILFSENKTAYLLLIITTLGWGCNAVFAKLAVGEVSPMLLVSIRWLITMVLLICLFW